jgi:arylformamidase
MAARPRLTGVIMIESQLTTKLKVVVQSPNSVPIARRTLVNVVVDLSHAVTQQDNIGTRLVAPFYLDPGRADLAGVPLERLVNVPIELVRANNAGEVNPIHLGDPGLLWGRAVLVYTGWARRWRTAAYWEPNGPYLTAAAIDLLVGANVAIVGIDAGGVDHPAGPARPGRDALLAADIPILEHLTNLRLVPDTGARLTTLPPPIRGAAATWVRAIAVLPA